VPIAFPQLRVLLHLDTGQKQWIAHALECDLAAQGVDAMTAVGGILRQVAAVGWIRLHGGASPAAAPPALQAVWNTATADRDDGPWPDCLLHDATGCRRIRVEIEVRRTKSAVVRLPGDPPAALSQAQLLAALARRGSKPRQEPVALLGGWVRPRNLELLVHGSRLGPYDLPDNLSDIAASVAGAMLRRA